MTFFRKSRPQDLFEGVWVESFFVTSLMWEMTLAFHSSDSEEVRTNFLSFMENKSDEIFQISEQLFNIRREIVDLYYENIPEPHKEEWYPFIKELGSFEEKTIFALTRLFLLKSILMQIDEAHPKKRDLETAFRQGLERLSEAKKLTDKITNEIEQAHQAVFDAIVIARSIEEDISFEEAEKRERKRWE